MTDPKPTSSDATNDSTLNLDPLTMANAKISELEAKIKVLEDQSSAFNKQFSEVLQSNQKLLALASVKTEPASEPETSESDAYEDLIKAF